MQDEVRQDYSDRCGNDPKGFDYNLCNECYWESVNELGWKICGKILSRNSIRNILNDLKIKESYEPNKNNV